MNTVAKAETHVPATIGSVYTAYGLAVASDTAPFLKFVKGAYKFGIDDEDLPLGTQLIPNMPELRVGWVKWIDGRVFQDETKRLCDGPPPRREDLDCVEKADWPTDQNGDTKDPWQLQNTLPMRDPETGQQYVFTTGSHGGVSTIGKLSTDYGNYLSKHDDGFLPVIELGKSSYKHKSYGEVFIPVFHIVEWKSEAELMGGESAGHGADTGAAIDDEIPF